jgi:hypothetical protein
MDDRIPLTDFDLRQFPAITEDDKADFIIHTNKFERIYLTKENVVSDLVQPQKASPAVAGQYRAINLIQHLATNPNLIPLHKPVTNNSFDKLFDWFKLLHKNILYDFYLRGEQYNNFIDYPMLKEIGVYRYEDKILGSRKMPDPQHIKDLLAKAFVEYITVYRRYADNLNNPRMLDFKDWKRLGDAAYQLNLHICCIKPFKDGSNRVARLTENLLRLNVGLRFRTFDDLRDPNGPIWRMQDSIYAQK